MKVLESELRGKTVMSEEGLYLGIHRKAEPRVGPAVRVS